MIFLDNVIHVRLCSKQLVFFNYSNLFTHHCVSRFSKSKEQQALSHNQGKRKSIVTPTCEICTRCAFYIWGLADPTCGACEVRINNFLAIRIQVDKHPQYEFSSCCGLSLWPCKIHIKRAKGILCLAYILVNDWLSIQWISSLYRTTTRCTCNRHNKRCIQGISHQYCYWNCIVIRVNLIILDNSICFRRTVYWISFSPSQWSLSKVLV